MELGVFSFVERTPEAGTAEPLSADQRLRNLMEEIELADQVGLDVFGIGEHHRPDYVSSAPAVILAAAAARTRRIRLTSAVTVLSSDDPVRVFQQFATLDLLSSGRAEIMAGRGSFIESFPLFGYPLEDYNELFEEKLQLLLRLREEERVMWSGKYRRKLNGEGVYPRPIQNPLPVWVAIGGTPSSAARAGRLGLPLALAILGGSPAQFLPLIESYRRIGSEAGHPPERLSVGINLHGFIAESYEKAVETAYGPFNAVMNKIGRERGWPPSGMREFESTIKAGSLLVGSPEEVAQAILAQHSYLKHQRTMIQLTVGSLPHPSVLKAIELLGTKVAPLVRKELAKQILD